MQITTDEATYDSLQRNLVEVVACDVRDRLREAAATGATLEQAVQSITAGLAAILDGAQPLERDGEPVIPVLLFGAPSERGEIAEALTRGGASLMQQYAAGIAEAVMAEAVLASAHPSDGSAPETIPLEGEG